MQGVQESFIHKLCDVVFDNRLASWLRPLEYFLCNNLNCQYVNVWVNRDGGALLHSVDLAGDEVSLHLSQQNSLLFSVIQNREPFWDNNIIINKDFKRKVDNYFGYRLKSVFFYPVVVQERVIAVISAYASARHPKRFTQKDVELLDMLLEHLGRYLFKYLYPEKSTAAAPKESAQECAELERKQKEQMEVFASSIHDLKTPVNAIKGFLEILRMEIDDKKQLDYINDVIESSEILSDIVTKTLNYIKYNDNQLLVLNEVKLDNPIDKFRQVAEMFTAKMKVKSIEYGIFISSNIPSSITVDFEKLKRVFINLIGNAYKFVNRGELIHVSIDFDAASSSLKCVVNDSGVGISKDRQAEIFKMFAQEDDETQVSQGGFGVGLSTSSKFVKMMGGELKLLSEKGFGSRFYFDIPIKEHNNTRSLRPVENPQAIRVAILTHSKKLDTAENIYMYLQDIGVSNVDILDESMQGDFAEYTHMFVSIDRVDERTKRELVAHQLKLVIIKYQLLQSVAKSRGKIEEITTGTYYGKTIHNFFKERVEIKNRVLVVDDSQINLRLMNSILSSLVDIDTVDSGEKALEYFEKAVSKRAFYTLVFVDENMPTMSGKEVIASIRTMEREKELDGVNIVSISGDDSDRLREELSEFGVVDYISKPFKHLDVVTSYKRFGQLV